jgi:hypothetical protein
VYFLVLKSVKPYHRYVDERFTRLGHSLVILAQPVLRHGQLNVRSPPIDGASETPRENCSAFTSLEIQDEWTSHCGLWSEGDCPDTMR